MKIMIASDIHGSARWCRALLAARQAEKPQRLLLLGDLLYHGPRNDLPEEYAPKAVIAMLNDIADEILCVRGNCEAEVDQMVLNFPVMADYAALCLDDHLIYMTHGHIYNRDNPPPLKHGDILLCGHTHIPAFDHLEGFTSINPGSTSIPKNDTPHSYCILKEGWMEWKDLNRNNTVWRRENLW